MKLLLLHSRVFILLFLISGLILLADSWQLFSLPKQLLSYLTVPIQYGLYKTSLGVTNQFGFIFGARYAAKENKALKAQLGDLLSENADLRSRLAEAEGQLDQANSLSPKTFNLLAARPIGKDRFLIIDKGSLDGLKVNEVVVFKDNFIGTIKEVEAKTSRVQLGQDPDSKIAVFSQNSEGKAKGILLGQFGSEALMDKILHIENIKSGDLVYSDGTEGNLPRGLIIGKVTEVLERANEVFKQAKVKPIFEVGDLDIVFVIRNQ